MIGKYHDAAIGVELFDAPSKILKRERRCVASLLGSTVKHQLDSIAGMESEGDPIVVDAPKISRAQTYPQPDDSSTRRRPPCATPRPSSPASVHTQPPQNDGVVARSSDQRAARSHDPAAIARRSCKRARAHGGQPVQPPRCDPWLDPSFLNDTTQGLRNAPCWPFRDFSSTPKTLQSLRRGLLRLLTDVAKTKLSGSKKSR
jgi:hypothetical protein